MTEHCAATPTPPPRVVTRRTGAGLVLVAAVLVLVLRLEGRQFVSDSGVGLWTGAWTPHTSQWVADPYSTSHVLHGVLFFWCLFPLRRWLAATWRFVAAAVIEASWEALENSPWIIDRYRTATASLDYYGDSILNSSFDLLAALLGFWLAWRCGWKWMLLLIVVVELSMLCLVRDNLTLNVWMLLNPNEAIKQWQARS